MNTDDPITFQVLTKAGQVKAEVQAEIADTPELRRRGLSYRACLPDGYGMFFDKVGAYWMKGVNFPLDIIFMDKQGRVVDIQTMSQVADDDPQKPLYVAKDDKAAHALEVPAGWCADHKLDMGDFIRVAERYFV